MRAAALVLAGALLCTAARAQAPGIPLDLAAQVVAAEDARHAPRELVRRLDDPSPAVRARVALALGRIGDASLVGPLVGRLEREPDGATRAELCFALGLAARPEATKVLVQSLGLDPSPLVRIRAAQALGFVKSPLSGPALIAALPPAGKPIACGGDELMWQLAVALFRQKDERAVRPLADIATTAAFAQGSPCPELARAATWGLARQKSPLAADALHRLAHAPDAYVRAWAVRGLGDLGRARADEVLPALGRGHLERAHAIAAAGASHVAAAAPALRGLAAGDDRTLAVEAVHALGKLPDAGARPLLEHLRRGPGVRARAADLALARLGADDLLTFAGDPPAGTAGWTTLDWLGWVEALGASADPRARARLKALARLDATPEDPRLVRTAAAVGAFAENATKADLPELEWQLKRADPWVRANAVEQVGKLGGVAELPAIQAAFARAARDPNEDFRLAAVHAAEAMKEPAATAFLASASNDASRNVRAAAASALAARTGHTYPADLGPVATGRDDRYYRGVVARARPLARVTTTAGTFTIRLLTDFAPLTVDSFLTLARAGFFDGLAIPRVVPEFVVQMGDPRGDLSGGPGYVLRCEVNRLPYTRGTVGMALSGKDTGGSQFFVMHTRHAHLEGIYTIFGHVESGMDVVDGLAKGDRILSVRSE